MPTITHVTVTPSPINQFKNNWEVCPYWSDVKRPQGLSYIVIHQKTAEALRKCILEGRWFGPAKVVTDVNGDSFASAEGAANGRRVQSQLKKMGYL